MIKTVTGSFWQGQVFLESEATSNFFLLSFPRLPGEHKATPGKEYHFLTALFQIRDLFADTYIWTYCPLHFPCNTSWACHQWRTQAAPHSNTASHVGSWISLTFTRFHGEGDVSSKTAVLSVKCRTNSWQERGNYNLLRQWSCSSTKQHNSTIISVTARHRKTYWGFLY